MVRILRARFPLNQGEARTNVPISINRRQLSRAIFDSRQEAFPDRHGADCEAWLFAVAGRKYTINHQESHTLHVRSFLEDWPGPSPRFLKLTGTQ